MILVRHIVPYSLAKANPNTRFPTEMKTVSDFTYKANYSKYVSKLPNEKR